MSNVLVRQEVKKINFGSPECTVVDNMLPGEQILPSLDGAKEGRRKDSKNWSTTNKVAERILGLASASDRFPSTSKEAHFSTKREKNLD